ncbi:MAG: AlpA family phage regulatory protein [Acinetobacter ursingii]|nr:AlpA family phage regulatory protein [Acinetobacter ursingii]
MNSANHAFVGQTFTMHQIIGLKQVVSFTGIGKATIYNMMNPKSKYYDETFPKQVKLTTGRVGWLAFEIHQWIEGKMRNR